MAVATGVAFVDHAHELLFALFSPGQNEPKLLKPEIDLYVLLYYGVLQFVLNWGLRLYIVTVRDEAASPLLVLPAKCTVHIAAIRPAFARLQGQEVRD